MKKSAEYLTTPAHEISFFKKNNIRFEAELPVWEKKENWNELKQFIGSVHLPYSSPNGALNIGAFDDEQRKDDTLYLENAILQAAQYNVDRVIIHTCGFESINDELVGCYERTIDALKYLAGIAKEKKMLFCIENMVLRNPKQRHLYGSDASEWYRIYDDVNGSNVRLTLDTSHAASSILGYKTREQREKHIFDFLARPEVIAHVHWSDSRIATQDALFGDLHLIPGDGDLPINFHKKIRHLDAKLVFEHACSDEDVLREINFAESLGD